MSVTKNPRIIALFDVDGTLTAARKVRRVASSCITRGRLESSRSLIFTTCGYNIAEKCARCSSFILTNRTQ